MEIGDLGNMTIIEGCENLSDVGVAVGVIEELAEASAVIICDRLKQCIAYKQLTQG